MDLVCCLSVFLLFLLDAHLMYYEYVWIKHSNWNTKVRANLHREPPNVLDLGITHAPHAALPTQGP